MAKIISLDEQRLNKLPAGELAPQLIALPARRRLDLLFERPDCAAVVAAMPAQDFFLTLKDAPDADALVLLSLANREQLDHIIDIEGWEGDTVHPGRVLHWCAAMLAAGERPLLTWLYHADFELLVTLFRQWIELLPADEDEDDKKGAPTRETIDGVRFFAIRYPDYREVILFMLRYLFEVHQPFYQELFWSIEAALPSELAELAYQFHRGRLADNAIPDPEEAHTIYHPLFPYNIQTHEKFIDVVERPAGFALVQATTLDEETLLARALRMVPPGRIESLAQELTSLANKIVVADRLPVDEPESLRGAAAKAAATVNLGLELYSGPAPDMGQASRVLEEVFLEDLFRLGHTAIHKTVAPLRTLTRTGWLSRWPHGLAILDPPWAEMAEAALAPTAHVIGDNAAERLVTSRADLERLAELRETVTAAGSLFAEMERRFGRFWESFTLWSQGQVSSLAAVTLGTILFTSTVRLWWQGEQRPEPLPVAAWPEIVTIILGKRPLAISAANVLLAGCGNAFRPAAQRYLAPFLNHVAETVNSWPGQTPDPRLADFLLFHPPR